MEGIKQYLPWIIGGIVLIYVLRKFTTKTALLPQTQFTQTPQPDPYADARTKAFELISGLGIAQTQADVDKFQAAEASALSKFQVAEAGAIERLRIGAEKDVNISAIELQNRLANLNILQRSQDRDLQQSAIDRYYSSRNTQSIVGSIGQTLGQIFGGRGPNIFGTPPTFPRGTFDFGGF